MPFDQSLFPNPIDPNPAHRVAQLLMNLLIRESFMTKVMLEDLLPDPLDRAVAITKARQRLHREGKSAKDTAAMCEICQQRCNWVSNTLKAVGAPVTDEELSAILEDPAVAVAADSLSLFI